MSLNNNKIPKRYSIQLPENVSALYCTKKRILVLDGPVKRLSVKLEVQLFIRDGGSRIEISDLPFSGISNVKKKKIKATQGTTVAVIKQTLMETTGSFYYNLVFVGVGYRAFPMDNYEGSVFMLKLGLSHFIYFRVPEASKIECQKFTRLFISGQSLEHTTQLVATIRGFKRPEPYKGKGILFKGEKIKLKEGKRV